MDATDDRQDMLAEAIDLVGDDSTKVPVVEVQTIEEVPAERPAAAPKAKKAPTMSEEEWVATIKESPFAIRKVAKREQTDDMVLAAIIEGESEFKLPNGDVMKSTARPLLNDKSIAKARINTHVLNELLKANPWRLPEIPEKKLNRALVRTAVEHSEGHPEVLSMVPDKFKTKPICTLAVEKDPRALQYVPDDFKTRKLCKSAVERDESVIQWVPKGYIDAKTRRSAEKTLKDAREAEEKAKAEAEVKAREEAERAKAEAEKAKAAAAEKADEAKTDVDEAKETVETKAESVRAAAKTKVAEARKAVRRSNPLRRHFRLVHQG